MYFTVDRRFGPERKWGNGCRQCKRRDKRVEDDVRAICVSDIHLYLRGHLPFTPLLPAPVSLSLSLSFF